MINTSVLVAYMLAIILFLGTPGPVTVMVVNASIRDGFFAGLKTVAGTNFASLILIVFSFVVIQGVFAVSEVSLSWLTLLGSIYLVYFAIGIIKDKIDVNVLEISKPEAIQKKSVQDPANQSRQSNQSRNYFKDGFTIGISNPKDILFFIAFFPMFLNISSNLHVSMALLVLIWIILDYAILTVYSFVFAKINNNKIANMINKFAGLLLLLVAIFAIYKTVTSLFFSS